MIFTIPRDVESQVYITNSGIMATLVVNKSAMPLFFCMGLD